MRHSRSLIISSWATSMPECYISLKFTPLQYSDHVERGKETINYRNPKFEDMYGVKVSQIMRSLMNLPCIDTMR
jgi:hypothetical protein